MFEVKIYYDSFKRDLPPLLSEKISEFGLDAFTVHYKRKLEDIRDVVEFILDSSENIRRVHRYGSSALWYIPMTGYKIEVKDRTAHKLVKYNLGDFTANPATIKTKILKDLGVDG